MDIKQLKKLRDLTGASIGECKRALESCSTFEDAVTVVKDMVSAREAGELSDEAERAAQQQAAFEQREAAEAEAEFIRTMTQTFGLTQDELDSILKEEAGDKARVLERGPALRREKARQRQLAQDAALDASGWSLATSFRSQKTLRGSSKVIISFECVQDARIEFRLDLASGIMDRLKDWSAHLLMPGQDPSDKEPLAGWWVSSEDRRLILTMNEAWLEDVTFDNAMVKDTDYPEVAVLLEDLTNIAVRDLWIENDK